MSGGNETVPATAVILVLLRRLFPAWDIHLCERGIWRAEGSILISASSCDGFVQALGGADPEAMAKAVEVLCPPT